MSLAKLAVKNPVFAVMINLFFIVFGVISYFMVGLQANPNITFPVITVTTMLPGGNSQIINQAITKPMESVLNTIQGVQTINSTSSPNQSEVTLQFRLDTDINAAFGEVQSKLNQVIGEFPKGTKPPLIQKQSTTESPVMMIAVQGQRSLQELTEITQNVIQKRLQNVSGVADARIESSSPVVLMITLDLPKMAALGISPANIESAFARRHVDLPGGFIRSGSKAYVLDLDMEFHTIPEILHVIIDYRKEAPIRLKDVASVKMDVLDADRVSTLNGHDALGISILKRQGANTVTTVQSLKKVIEELNVGLPSDVHISVIYEEASYILSVVDELKTDIILSVLAAGLVIWLFLRSVRLTLIISTAIPVSLLGAVLAIYFFDYTLNIITLLGLILLVGVVVDDAIVVLENIYRHMEHHRLDPERSAIKGTNQVVFAVLAATLSLVTIFLPVVFMGGILGMFFKSFAVVITAGVLISYLVALTLIPVLSAKFIKIVDQHSTVYRYLEHLFASLELFYKKVLAYSLRHRWLMVALALATILLSVPILMVIGKGFLPEDRDTGHFQIMVETPQGYSAQFTKSRMVLAGDILAKQGDIETYFSSISKENSGSISVNLHKEKERKQSQQETMDTLQAQLKTIPGALFIVSNTQAGGSMNFEVHGQDYVGTVNTAFKFYSALSKEPDLGELYLHISLDQPQYSLVIDRAMSSSLGLSADEVGSATMVLSEQGVEVAKYNKKNGAERYDIVLKADDNSHTNANDLSQIYLMNQKGKQISLDTVSSFVSSSAPLDITRRNQQYSVAFTASPKVSLNKAINLVENTAKDNLPPGYGFSLTGDTESLGSTQTSMIYTLALILVLMYMVLASQFNSYIQPFIIMIAQPMAFIGGILVLWLCQQTLNMYSMIGGLLLMGLVAKNSILLIDLTNQLRQAGQTVNEALLSACPQRMRPVLMTSCAIILAMAPAALMPGTASSSHRPLALVIIGGMISSTLLTLVIVPAIYSLLQRDKSQS
jgi:HAE1 family hydrophobic/amphiphilic exporter-1